MDKKISQFCPSGITDEGGETDISEDALIKVLSMGERRALYLVNVIFEVRRRMKDQLETLVVVDDIADSFDYNNKYVIIQYLQDIIKNNMMKIIIMTHNFDFFRTVESRFVDYGRCLMATRGGNRNYTDCSVRDSKCNK